MASPEVSMLKSRLRTGSTGTSCPPVVLRTSTHLLLLVLFIFDTCSGVYCCPGLFLTSLLLPCPPFSDICASERRPLIYLPFSVGSLENHHPPHEPFPQAVWRKRPPRLHN